MSMGIDLMMDDPYVSPDTKDKVCKAFSSSLEDLTKALAELKVERELNIKENKKYPIA